MKKIFLLGAELIKLKCPEILFLGMNPSHDIKQMIACNFFRKNISEGGCVAGESCLPGWTVLDRIVTYYRDFCTYANMNTVEAIRRN